MICYKCDKSVSGRNNWKWFKLFPKKDNSEVMGVGCSSIGEIVKGILIKDDLLTDIVLCNSCHKGVII